MLNLGRSFTNNFGNLMPANSASLVKNLSSLNNQNLQNLAKLNLLRNCELNNNSSFTNIYAKTIQFRSYSTGAVPKTTSELAKKSTTKPTIIKTAPKKDIITELQTELRDIVNKELEKQKDWAFGTNFIRSHDYELSEMEQEGFVELTRTFKGKRIKVIFMAFTPKQISAQDPMKKFNTDVDPNSAEAQDRPLYIVIGEPQKKIQTQQKQDEEEETPDIQNAYTVFCSVDPENKITLKSVGGFNEPWMLPIDVASEEFKSKVIDMLAALEIDSDTAKFANEYGHHRFLGFTAALQRLKEVLETQA